MPLTPDDVVAAVEEYERVLTSDHAGTCSSRCDDDDGPRTSDGPCGDRAHFDASGKIHVACSCGWLDDWKRTRATLLARMRAAEGLATALETLNAYEDFGDPNYCLECSPEQPTAWRAARAAILEALTAYRAETGEGG